MQETFKIGDIVESEGNWYKLIAGDFSSINNKTYRGLLTLYGKSLRPVRNNQTVKTLFYCVRKVTKEEIVNCKAILDKRLRAIQDSVDWLDTLEKEIT